MVHFESYAFISAVPEGPELASYPFPLSSTYKFPNQSIILSRTDAPAADHWRPDAVGTAILAPLWQNSRCDASLSLLSTALRLIQLSLDLAGSDPALTYIMINYGYNT
jgi:hypothetical protein